jgi:hypothetical protein
MSTTGIITLVGLALARVAIALTDLAGRAGPTLSDSEERSRSN